MIKELIIRNFKLFKEEVTIPLSKINLLTGINGRGKSTVLQSLLLMKQSPDHDRTTNKIILNGNNVKLGGYKDIKNIESNENIEFTFKYPDFFIKYSLMPNEFDPMVADIESIESASYDNNFKLHLQKNGNHFSAEFNENSKESRFNAYLHDLFI